MATEAIELDLRGLPPYTAVSWAQFEQNPRILYNLFEPSIRPGGNYISDKVFDMTGAKLNQKLCELKVDNVEELHRLTRDLLRMPILFRVKVEHTRTDHYVVMKVRKKWRDEFAILVNTQHPQIREILSRRLSEAMQYMTEGKNFCLKIGFGQSVRQWYSGIVDSEVTLCDSRSNSDDGNMSIYIHNYSTPMDCCMHPLCIFCCFPFWLLCGGPCYFVNRKLKCTDVVEHVRDLPVTMVTGQRTILIEHHIQPEPCVQADQYRHQPPGGGHSGQQNGMPYNNVLPPPQSAQQMQHGPYGGQQIPCVQFGGQQVPPVQYGGPQMANPPPYSP
ncbi:unnamed protein product [Mytilus edulis]|uniref:Uncharacterized protein n=1 Tax=Mytilus edulis TaxID=6550 RepID=A0A8S3QH81_MYTED|nr:unnamed protein product [Mytilus edulis]